MKNIDKLMNVAEAVSHLSKDRTKIGAIVISHDNRIIGTGFNGYPPGYDDSDLTNKYDKVIHAEMNAIINSSCNRGEIHGIVIYGLPPCPDCMKHLAAYGVEEVVYRVNKDIASYKDWKCKHEALVGLHRFKVIEI
jgi:dCMP deaminase